MINCYIVEVKGRNLKRFINKLFKLGINIIDLKKTPNRIVFKVSYQDYTKIKAIKTIYEVNIIGVKGVKKIELLINKYKIFLIFFVFGMALIVLASHFILFIDIDHEKEDVRNLIKNKLKENGLVLFSFTKDYDELMVIKDRIKKDLKDQVEWLEIERIGVTYKVKVIERIISSQDEDLEKVNIVASKKGVIMDMYVERGEIVKNKGDYVNKGDVIVSGIIKRNDNIVNVVSAKAKVYAEVWYKVKLDAEFNYTLENNEGPGKRSLIINIWGKDFKLFSFKKGKVSDRTKKFFSSSIMSINLKDEVTEREISKKYTEEELLEKLESEALKEMEAKLDDTERVLMQKTLKKKIDNDRMYIEVFFKVYEDIATKQKIAKEDLEVKKED